MKNTKRKMFCVLIIIALIAIFILGYIENRPFYIASSSVFTMDENTEIQMYILMNALGNIDDEELAGEVILEHQKINGIRGNTVYTLKLYRTLLHYRRNWEYDTITCDENGAIICCEEDLGV